MAEVWNDDRWRRSARRWRIAVLLVVVAVAVLSVVLWSMPGPKIAPRVYRSVAGPQVRIVHAESGTIATGGPVEYLVVEVDGTDPPEQVLQAALLSHGWQLRAPEATLPAAVGGGDGYRLSWNSAAAAMPDLEGEPLAKHLDPADPREFLVEVDDNAVMVPA